jgi:hypothetical protein
MQSIGESEIEPEKAFYRTNTEHGTYECDVPSCFTNTYDMSFPCSHLFQRLNGVLELPVLLEKSIADKLMTRNPRFSALTNCSSDFFDRIKRR